MVLDNIGAACILPGLWHHPIWTLDKSTLERVDSPKHSARQGVRCSRVAMLAIFEGHRSSAGGAL